MEQPFNVKNQVGPCGITCGTCFLGDGIMAKTMAEADKYINMSGIKEWAPMVPGGAEINWKAAQNALSWMQKYAYCAGCEQGGGPPDCTIRTCATGKGYALCNMCGELDSCDKFSWLGEGSEGLKEKLRQNKGKTKQELANEALEAR
jgi:hypothetical protein